MNRHFSLILFVGVAGALGLHVRPCLSTCPLGKTAFAAVKNQHQGAVVAPCEEDRGDDDQDFVTYEDGNGVEQSMASVETTLDAFVDQLASEEKPGSGAGASAVPALMVTSTPAAARAASKVLRPALTRSTNAPEPQVAPSRRRATRPSFGELQLTR